MAIAIDRIGKFQVLSTLGKGAHSTIFHVRRQADSREYALKTVSISGKEDQKFLEQVRHEIRVAKMLDHANLIKVHCLETEKDWLFRVRKVNLLIEFVNGAALDQYPLMNLQKLVPILAIVAGALGHMHRRGVYHGDMKPNNILLGKRGEVKIIDYGLAWIKGESKDRVQGTPEYIAPETLRAKVVNDKTDIFNLGATLYRLATLKYPPSCAASAASLRINEKAWNAMFVPRTAHRRVPEDLCKLIRGCMEFNPAKRPESMGDVYEELKQISANLGEMIEGGTEPNR